MKKQFVQLNPKSARWHLDNPEIYEIPSTGMIPKNSSYEIDTLIHLICCLGEPVYGEIIKPSPSMQDCWLVRFKIADLETQYYVEREHVTFLNARPKSKPVSEIETLITQFNSVNASHLELETEVQSLRVENEKLVHIVNRIREEVNVG